MDIIYYECKKAFTSPILIALLLLFASYNILLIVSTSDRREELKVANQLAGKYGVGITDDSMNQFREDLQHDLVKLNEITRTDYSEAELDFFTELQLKEKYYEMANDIDNRYDQIDWEQIGESQINMYRFSGSAADTMKNEYIKLSLRFEEMKDNDEHKMWFFAGDPYKMHSFLFRTIFGHVIFESLIIIALAAALITNYEFENRTHLVAYTTTRGRRLMRDKLAASLLTATTVSVFILILTLGTYFAVFDYSHLWGSSISSALNWEYKLPYVSWWNISFSAFLIWSILLVYASMMLFTAIIFSISIFVKNNYFTFFIFAVFFAVALLLPGFIPASTNLIFIAGYNLSQLVMNPHMFLMGNSSGAMMFKNYEWITICAWTIIVVALSYISLRRFRKQDIH
ncbi:hypothetical protein PAECIP111893_02090 [Paenibacillus plantiphilus]|uniref:ABC transporter permease n=1 Tax=Paenibacillus plantiphilus TaxID=2905650 RepID=A0ABM9C6J5_9BACL|nr:hypothetical protein [Paenibacillus plantiphilus]CAH1203850.1 hypothetical protein PAECIP111893_02090 [Paenibacillus plantiphilus]